MKKIEIEVPEGMTDRVDHTENGVIITFEKKNKGKIEDRVKTFEDAWSESSEAARKRFTANTGPAEAQKSKDLIAYEKLVLINGVINEGWKPDFLNSDQNKYYPWFEVKSSGSGSVLSCGDYYYTYTNADVGSRLCFSTADKAKYVGNQFIDIYTDYLL